MDYVAIGFLLVFSIFSAIDLTASLAPPLLLTPLIKINKTEDARKFSEVKPSLFLNISSHSGFLTVDSTCNSNTFFWYFPVAGKPVNETPWIVWFQGGTGSSAMVGLFDEIGPFKYEQQELKLRDYSWTKQYSVVFIDNPGGAGYSSTEKKEGCPWKMNVSAGHLSTALQQLVVVFPELRKAPLYLAGESYASRYAAALADHILEKKLEVQLEGIILGNPIINLEDVANYSAAFYQWGLIDSKGVADAKTLQEKYLTAVQSGNWGDAYKLQQELQDLANSKQLFNLLKDNYQPSEYEKFLSTEEIRDAIHVGNRTFVSDRMLVPDVLENMQPVVERLLDNYKVLIYCGQLDLTSSCVQSAEVRRSKWRWGRRGEFLSAPRVPWWMNETLAGYAKKGGRLTETLVIGAGALVPIDKPAEVFELVSNFIDDKEPEVPPPYMDSPEVNTNITAPITNSTTPGPVSVPTAPTNVTNANNINSTANNASTINGNTTAPTNISNNVVPLNRNAFTNTSNPTISNTADTTIALTHGNTTNNKIPPKTTNNTALNESQYDKNKNAEALKQPSEGTKEHQTPPSEGTSAGTIISIILNVLLVLTLVGGALYFYRQRRRTADFFYSNVETNSDDIFLT